MPKVVDISGERFGKLLAVEKDKSKGKSKWVCVCDCGQICTITLSCLRQGRTKSCGCLAKELSSKRNSTHKMSRSTEYKCWTAMIQRCTNKNYRYYDIYSQLGIEEDWVNSFELFIEHIGNRPDLNHTIGRIDNLKGYFKGNVRWETKQDQARNRRKYSTNNTGVNGVSLFKNNTRGKIYWYYRVSWIDNGKKMQKNFSVAILGLIPSFYKACLFRLEKIKEQISNGVYYATTHGEGGN